MEFIIGLATGIAVGIAIYARVSPAEVTIEQNPALLTFPNNEHTTMAATGIVVQKVRDLRNEANLPSGTLHVRLTENGLVVFDDGGR